MWTIWNWPPRSYLTRSNEKRYLEEAKYWGDIEPVTPWMGADTARHYQWYPFVNLGHYLIALAADAETRQKFIELSQARNRKSLPERKIERLLNGNSFYLVLQQPCRRDAYSNQTLSGIIRR